MTSRTNNGNNVFLRRLSDSFYKLEKSRNNMIMHNIGSISEKRTTVGAAERQRSKVDATLGKKILKALTVFGSTTSIHGCQFVVATGLKPYKRLLWLLLIFACFGILVFQIVDRIVYYYTWPVTVNVKINFNRTLTFPAVTICNQNAFRATLATDLGRYRLLEAMYTSEGPINTTYIFEKAENLTLHDIFIPTAHRKEDLIFDCIWKGTKCKSNDFVTTLTDDGVCYTWNSNSNGLFVTAPGISNGLQLKLNVEQSEYMPGPHSVAGVKFLLHAANELPMVHALGQAISAGSHVFVGVKVKEGKNKLMITTTVKKVDRTTSCDYQMYHWEKLTSHTNLKRHTILYGPWRFSTQLSTMGHGQHFHLVNNLTTSQVNNLPDPHGKCSYNELEYVDSYSITGCKLNCLSKLSDQTCGCRHIYMPHNKGKPKVCTVKTYYNCLQTVIASFPSMSERVCNCPVPCSLHDFETDLSYASISKYAVNKFFDKNKTVEFRKKLIDVNEVTSRMDGAKLEELHELAEHFEHKLEKIEHLFDHKLDHLIHDIVHLLEDEFGQLSWLCEWKTFVYDYQYYAIKKNFVRYRDAMEERHAHIIASGYSEFILSLESKIKTLYNLVSSNSDLRQYTYLDILSIIDIRKEIIQRTVGNFTRLINAYKTGNRIFNYKYDHAPLNHNSYIVPVGLLQASVNNSTENVRLYEYYLNETSFILDQFIYLTRGIYYKNSMNDSFLELLVGDFNTAMTNWMTARYDVYDAVIERPLNVLSIDKENYERLCFTYQTLTTSVKKKFEFLDVKVEGVKTTLFKPLVALHDIIHEYVKNGIGFKYKIAQNFTSGEILIGNTNLENLMFELLTKESDFRDEFREIESTTKHIYKAVVEDDCSANYYNFTSNFMLLRNSSEILNEVKSNYTKYIEMIRFYDVVGEEGLNFNKAVVDLVAYFQNYLHTLQIDKRFIRENVAQLDIFYRQMNYEEVTQQVAFDTFALFCDIGGAMGLFLGASLLSLCELLDLIWGNMFKSADESNSHQTVVVEPAVQTM